MKIYAVRHGETNWNVLGKMQGSVDNELNEIGVEQARKTMEKLKDEKIDLIICSPLKRTIQTADIINERKNIPIIYDERIKERNGGEFEGKTIQEYNYADYSSYEKNLTFKKAEKVRDFFNRVYGFMDDITSKYKDKNVLIVTHAGVIKPITFYFSKEKITDKAIEEIYPKNCEITKWEI